MDPDLQKRIVWAMQSAAEKAAASAQTE